MALQEPSRPLAFPSIWPHALSSVWVLRLSVGRQPLLDYGGLYHCICLLSGAVVEYFEQKQFGKEQSCLAYTSTPRSFIEGSQGRNSSRCHRGRLLGGLLFRAHSACFLCTPGTTCLWVVPLAHVPKGGTTRSGPGPSSLIVNQGNASQTCPRANLVETCSQVKFLLPRWP